MSEKQGTHFWFMTIQTPRADGRTHVGEYSGTITPKRGETRLDLYRWLRADVCAKYPDSQSGSVIAFDLQPNKL